MKVTMKLNNHILSALAPALLLCAAAFGMTGCSQSDDGLQGAPGTVSRGGEPIRVSIAAKPGFTDSNTPGTRATVGDDGAFGWSEGTDKISVCILFNNPGSTLYYHTWISKPGTTTGYITDWKVLKNWGNYATEDFTGDLVWPLGATSASTMSFYTDCTLGNRTGDGANEVIELLYNNGATGDHMTFKKTLAPGESLAVDFSHATTRLVLNGLKPATAYSLKAGGTALTFPTHLSVKNFALLTPAEQTFTSDADGKLVICAALDGKLDASHKVSLEVMEGGASGTSAGTVELTAKGSDADGWKMDGHMYTVNFVNGGAIDPESNPDLLIPAPIVAGNKVYAMNGYFFTAADLQTYEYDMGQNHVWSTNPDATEIDNDPCAGHGNWRMPSMKDYEHLFFPDGTGLASDRTTKVDMAWTQDGGKRAYLDYNSPATNLFDTTFGDTGYWSSDVVASDNSKVWIFVYDNNNAIVDYSQANKSEQKKVRCIQEQ